MLAQYIDGPAPLPFLFPRGAVFAADFTRQLYFNTEAPACVRASPALAPDVAGDYVTFGNDVLRLTDAGLYVPEPAFTELGNRATMAGAVIGVLGAGGALPTGWSETAQANGVAVEVVAIGTHRGLPAIDVRFSGTPSNNWRIRPSATRGLAVAASTSYAASAFFALVSGALPQSDDARFGVLWYNSGTFLSASYIDVAPTVDADLNPYSSIVSSPATANEANLDLVFSVTTGEAIDFTLRFAAPNMGVGTAASSPVLAAGTPRTRVADAVTIPAPSGTYDLHLLLDDATEEVVPGFQDGDALPLTLPQGKFIQKAWGMAA